MKPILCLDFDGVICDSFDETLLAAYNSYQIFQCHRKNTAYTYLGTNPENFTSLSHTPSEISKSFRQFRHLVRPAGEYWLLMYLLHTGSSNITQEKFNELLLLHRETIIAFEPYFFKVREKLQTENPSKWLSLHRLYPQFSEAWPDLRHQYEVYIVTTKNLSAVTTLIEYFDISIPKENLWTKERTNQKKQAIEAIAQKHDLPCGDILFVDDHPLHVQDVAKTGANCLWARWGYSKKSADAQKSVNHLRELLEKTRNEN